MAKALKFSRSTRSSLERQRQILTAEFYHFFERNPVAYFLQRLQAPAIGARYATAVRREQDEHWQRQGVRELRLSRRMLLKAFAATAVVAIATGVPGTVNAAPITLRNIGMVAPDIVCIELLDEELIQYPLVATTAPSGGTITGIVANASGGMRVTVASAKSYTSPVLLAVKGCANNGSGAIRLTVYDTADLNAGSQIYVYNTGGVTAAEGQWSFTIVDGTHIDLTGSTFSGTFTFGGFCSQLANNGVPGETSNIRSVVGTEEANGACWGALWSSTEIDIIDYLPLNSMFFSTSANWHMRGAPQLVNAYVSGGTITRQGNLETATNPFTSASETAFRCGRNNNYLKFSGGNSYDHIDRTAADLLSNWGTIGGLTVDAVYRKSMPYQQAQNLFEKQARMRHYLFLKLSGNLAQTTHSIDLSHIGLSATQEFIWNDKLARSQAIHTTQHGHRPSDVYKKGKLSIWVPGHGSEEGAVNYSTYGLVGANKAHLINEAGTIVHTFDVMLRISPTDCEPSRITASNVRGVANGSISTITDNGSGAIRITLNSAVFPGTATPSGGNKLLVTGDRVLIRKTLGQFGSTVPSALGQWQITKISEHVFDLDGSTFDGGTYTVNNYSILSHHPMSSVTNRVAITNIDKTVVPCRVTAPGHGLQTGDTIRPEAIGFQNTWTPAGGGTREPRAIDGAGRTQFNTRTYLAVRIDDNIIALQDADGTDIDATDQPPWVGGGGFINKLNKMNGAGTYVYDLDYSGFTGAGLHRLYIPGLGVSDEMRFDDEVWNDAAAVHAAGDYHQRCSTVDGRFGTTYPAPTYYDGVDGVRKYRSNLPVAFSTQNLAITSEGAPTGQGGYSPWITTTRIDVRGGHMDAADSDCFALHHMLGYYDYLEVWEVCPAARNTNHNLPKASELIGGIWDASTDALGDLGQAGIWGIDFYRQAMGLDGATIGGQMASSQPEGGDVGQNFWEPSWIHRGRHFTFAGDHASNYIIAGTLAKGSRVLTIAGMTAQALAYKNAAILMWDWAEAIRTSAPNAAGARDTYYKTVLGLQTGLGWSDGQYATAQNALDNTINVRGFRSFAAGNLFRLTGEVAYETAFIASFQSGANLSQYIGRGMWEFSHGNPQTAPGQALVTGSEGQWYNGLQSLWAYYKPVDYFGNFTPGVNAYENMQDNATVFANFGGWGTTIFEYAWMLMHLHVRSFEINGVYDPFPLEILQGGMVHNLGANQAGVSLTEGIGVRPIKAQLHNNRGAFGDGVRPRGVSTFYYVNFALIATSTFFNLDNGPANQTCQYPDEVQFPGETAKVITPSFLNWPLLEPPIEASLIIAGMEYTIAGQIMPNYAYSMYLSAWDANDPSGTPPTPGWRPRFGSNENHVLIDRRAA